MLRFAIQIPDAPDAATWVEKVRRAEAMGFDSVSVPDHLGPSLPQLAPMVALAAAATATERLRLAITVLDNDFRHPVMLAKEAATLDLVSDGRLDLGLGAGWLEEDYTKTGVSTWDSPGTRVSRLEESIQLLKKLWAGGPVTHRGEHYEVSDFESFPSPVQEPIPIMIGGGGPRMLRMAAREADIISTMVKIGVDADHRQAAFEQQLAIIADAGGRDREDLTVGVRVFIGEVLAAGSSRREAAARLGQRFGMAAEEVECSPFGVVGDPAAIKDHLLWVHETYGIGYFTISEHLAWDLGPVIEELSTL